MTAYLHESRLINTALIVDIDNHVTILSYFFKWLTCTNWYLACYMDFKDSHDCKIHVEQSQRF